MKHEPEVEDATALAQEIGKLLAGKDPMLQGAVLVLLLSRWTAGWYLNGAGIMDQSLADVVALAREMVPCDVALLKRRQQ